MLVLSGEIRIGSCDSTIKISAARAPKTFSCQPIKWRKAEVSILSRVLTDRTTFQVVFAPCEFTFQTKMAEGRGLDPQRVLRRQIAFQATPTPCGFTFQRDTLFCATITPHRHPRPSRDSHPNLSFYRMIVEVCCTCLLWEVLFGFRFDGGTALGFPSCSEVNAALYTNVCDGEVEDRRDHFTHQSRVYFVIDRQEKYCVEVEKCDKESLTLFACRHCGCHDNKYQPNTKESGATGRICTDYILVTKETFSYMNFSGIFV